MKGSIVLIVFIMMLNVSFVSANDEEIKLLLAKPFFKANFTKIRKLKIISQPFNTSGKVLFLPEKGLVWETLKPVRDVLFISHDGVGQFDKENKKLIKIDNPVIKSASVIFVTIISLDLERIKKIFDITILEPTNGLQRYRLTPKDKYIKKAIKQITIKGQQRVEELFIVEKSGDSTRVLFSDEQFEKKAFTRDELDILEMM